MAQSVEVKKMDADMAMLPGSYGKTTSVRA
jgi:hypothetical protein